MEDQQELIADLNKAIGEWDDDHPVSFLLLTRCRAALATPAVLREGLFDAIKHGDAQHQAWLKEALECYFAGKPVPRPSAAVSAAQAPIAQDTPKALIGCVQHDCKACVDLRHQLAAVTAALATAEGRIKELEALQK